MTKILAYTLMALSVLFLGTEVYSERPVEKEIKVVTIESTIDKDLLTEAFIQVESEGRINAVNKRTKATGVLQIMPIMIDQANLIAGTKKYKLSDRFNRDKSIEIFHLIMDNMNPEYDIHLAAKIWNPRCKLSYHRAVEKKYYELKERQ